SELDAWLKSADQAVLTSLESGMDLSAGLAVIAALSAFPDRAGVTRVSRSRGQGAVQTGPITRYLDVEQCCRRETQTVERSIR
ncbi:hypothetical protein AB0D54_37030, partial [Streptomyces xanthophaeus]|uniref:hypothetical protein n=1 Tax=Streptomyces xanthophaeus TaxID=67385 RepID=UPI0034195F85